MAVYRESPNAPFNSYHTMQMFFQSSPITFLATTFLTFLFILAYFMHVMEREYQEDEYTFSNSIWYTFTT